MRGSVDMNFMFTLGEVQRMLRAYADKQAARYGITRAQWAVLAKVERTEGLKQSELGRTDGNAADHADAADRPAVRQWLDRAPRRRNRPPRQPALSAQGGAPVTRQAERAALRTDGNRARRHQSGRTPTASSPNWKRSRKTCATPFRIRPANLRRRSSVMAEPVLKFPPEQKITPSSPPNAVARQPRRRLMAGLRVTAACFCWWCCRWWR